MSEFSGMEDMLQEFLQEATELLNEVDLKLVDLERRPDDRGLLNEIFRGFHTIKGGAGFLNLTALVELCHRTENLFDKLRSGTLTLTPEMLDVILAATAAVRAMFDELTQGRSPVPPEAALLSALEGAAEGSARLHEPLPGKHTDIDWTALHKAVAGNAAPAGTVPGQAADGDAPGRGMRNDAERTGIAKDASIRVDTDRLDYVLTLSGEIGLTKNRLTALRNDLLKGRVDAHTLKALDEAVNQLDLMVGNLQNAVMKTRMQPIGRLFRKYPRVARDLEIGRAHV